MKMYKLSQLIANELFSSHGFWFTPGYYLLQATIITFAYIIIRYNTTLPFVLFMFCVEAWVGVTFESYSMYQQAVTMRIRAQECIQSHLNQDGRNSLPTKVWRSCKPPVIQIGRQFTISSRCFCLEVYGLLVVRTVVDLLITFK